MENKKDILMSYIRSNVVPILVDFLIDYNIEDVILIPANTPIEELNGHYDGIEYLPPKWYSNLVNNKRRFIIIDKIDTISKEEQLKFCELLKYRKISTFEIPENCVIIITANAIKENEINEEIYSLVAQI